MIPKRTKVSKAEVLAHISESKGQLEPLERILNCTRGALRDLIRECPELQTELDDELERMKDRIIAAMMDEAIDGGKGSDRTRDLLLKAIARDRGFGEKLEVTGADGAPLVVLHSSANLLPVEEWAKKAAEFGESQEKVLDAKILELGLDGPPGLPVPEEETVEPGSGD